MWWSHWQPSLFNEFTFKSSELTQSTYSSDWKGCEFGRGGGGEVGGTLLSAVFVAYHFSPKFCLHFDGVCIFFFKASLYINSKDMFVPCSTVLIISCSFKKSFIRKIIIISRPPLSPTSIDWGLYTLKSTTIVVDFAHHRLRRLWTHWQFVKVSFFRRVFSALFVPRKRPL